MSKFKRTMDRVLSALWRENRVTNSNLSGQSAYIISAKEKIHFTPSLQTHIIRTIYGFFNVSRSGYYDYMNNPQKDETLAALYLSMIRGLNDNSVVAYQMGTERTVNPVLRTIQAAMAKEAVAGSYSSTAARVFNTPHEHTST